MSTKKDRILGALLGVHAGDSLGASYEFSSWADIRRFCPDGIPHQILGGGPFNWAVGHATDDTDMTRAVLLAYKELAAPSQRHGSLELAKSAGLHMLDWYNGRWPGRKPGSLPVDAGGATLAGLSAFAQNQHDPRRAGAGRGQAGNGSLMRCTPTALFAPDTAALVQQSALVSAITHNDARCILDCVVYNAIVAALVDGHRPAAAVDAGVATLAHKDTLGLVIAAFDNDDGPAASAHVPAMAHLLDGQKQVLDAVRQGRAVRVGDLAMLGPHQAPGWADAIPLDASGYVLESLTLGIAAVLDTDRCLEDLLVDVVSIGRDTDTNGAVAGGLLGARDGAAAIPQSWRETLQFGREFAEIVDALVPVRV